MSRGRAHPSLPADPSSGCTNCFWIWLATAAWAYFGAQWVGSWLALPLRQGGDSPRLRQVRIWLQGHWEGLPTQLGGTEVGLQKLRGCVPAWVRAITVVLQISVTAPGKPIPKILPCECCDCGCSWHWNLLLLLGPWSRSHPRGGGFGWHSSQKGMKSQLLFSWSGQEELLWRSSSLSIASLPWPCSMALLLCVM